MAKTEKALVMREIPASSNGSAITMHDDPQVAILQILQTDNLSKNKMVENLHLLMLEGQNALVQQLRQAQDQQRVFYEMQLSLFKAQQDALDRADDRRLNREERESKNKLLELIGHSIAANVPNLINKVTGSKVSEYEARTWQPIVASIRPDQWEKLSEVFDADQLMALKGAIDAMPELPTESPKEVSEEEPCDDE